MTCKSALNTSCRRKQKVHSPRWTVNPGLLSDLPRSTGRSCPSGGGSSCLDPNLHYYSWSQSTKRSSWFLAQKSRECVSAPVRLCLHQGGSIMDGLSYKLFSCLSFLQLLGFIVAYNSLIKWISGANRWFKSTSHFCFSSSLPFFPSSTMELPSLCPCSWTRQQFCLLNCLEKRSISWRKNLEKILRCNLALTTASSGQVTQTTSLFL